MTEYYLPCLIYLRSFWLVLEQCFFSICFFFGIINGKFPNFVFQKFPFYLGVQNEILVTVKSLNKIFVIL